MVLTGHIVSDKKRTPRVSLYVSVELEAQMERVFKYLQTLGDIPKNAKLGEYRAQVIQWCAEQAVQKLPPNF